MVPANKFLVNLPTNLTRQLNNLVVEFALLFVRYCIYATKSFAPVHIDPDLLQALFSLQIGLPKLIF